jgi:hypothetical protein
VVSSPGGGIGAVLGRVGKGLKQQAFVVDDLDAAKESMRRSFGCTRYFQFEMTVPWELRGRTVQCDLAIAFGRSGNMQIELMQPLRGEGVHFEMLAARGPSAHHLGCFVDDLDAMAEAATVDGFPPVMSSRVGGSRFCYLDTLDALGIYVELIEDPDDMIMKMMPWWDDPLPSR